ncbi:MAG: DNA polymerase III subunit beta [Thermodesulfobacteriota bacterium]
MRITIQKNDLSDVLSRIQGLTGRKTSLAITENVLMKTADTGITLAATDLETGFEGFFSAQIEAEGEVVINARKFGEIVKNFPTDAIRIQELENRWIEISSNQVEYHIVGMNPEEFPNIPRVDEINFFSMDSQALKKMIEKTVAVAVAGDEKRAHMIGVNMERLDGDGNKTLRMVSTDIKRLAKADYLCDPDSGMEAADGVIIPKKGLGEVNKFLEPEGTVELGVKDNHFIVRKENEYIIVNLLEGMFPAYQELLFPDSAYDITFEKDLLVMLLKRMSILTSDEYRGVIFHFDNNEFTARTVNASLGESKESMAIEYEREPMEIAFNPKYFIEAIHFIASDKVLLNIKDPDSPCIVRGADESSYLNIIMPMKI